MKFIPAAVTTRVARSMLHTQKASPTLLFGVGVAGMVASTVLACRATLQVEEVLDEANTKFETIDNTRNNKDFQAKYSEKDAKRDRGIVYIQSAGKLVRLYTPAIICGGVAIAALAGSQRILVKRNAALTATYAALHRSFNDYRDRVTAEVGREREEEIYRDVREVERHDPETGKKTKVKQVGPNNASIYAVFFDEFNKNWQKESEYNLIFLKMRQEYANHMLNARGHLFLNEVYDSLGMEHTSAGSVVGWVLSEEGDNFVDFGIFDGNSERARAFVNGHENAILLDFNVDGVIFDKIEGPRRKR